MDQEQAQELGQRLRERREQLGLSTRGLADRADTTHTTVVRLEQGAYDGTGPRAGNERALLRREPAYVGSDRRS